MTGTAVLSPNRRALSKLRTELESLFYRSGWGVLLCFVFFLTYPLKTRKAGVITVLLLVGHVHM